MVHRHPILYRLLGLIFLSITLVLVCLGIVAPWFSPARVALFTLSFFSLLLTLSYFELAIQEEQEVFW